MKNLFQLLGEKGIAIHIIAAAMIICVGVADLSLYVNYTERAISESVKTENEKVIIENHAMDIAMADGVYDGNNSDDPNSKEYPVEVIVSEDQPLYYYNILEIYPTEKKGVIGYTIAGHEPFEKANGDPIRAVKDSDPDETLLATEAQMREAYMDAVINVTPGARNANTTNQDSPSTDLVREIVGNMSTWLKEEGTSDAFKFETGKTYNGYYKYVGPDNGVFAKGELQSDGDREMFSRFYNYDSSKKYSYIFVYSKDESTDTRDVNVKNHKRISYKNNDRFIKDFLGVPEDDIQDWKNDHIINVKTRDPKSVSLQDIDDADLIIINNGNNMGYHRLALEIYNLTHHENNLNLDNDVVFSKQNDFDNIYDVNGTMTDSEGKAYWPGFEKTIRIYERVAVREDAAFITSKNCISGSNFDTNIRKLMCMLFYVRDEKKTGRDKYGNKYSDMAGSGREIFMDFMKRYVDEPGKYKLGVGEHPEITYYDLWTDKRYIAPSLRNNTERYMHHHIDNVETHPGHPLTTDITKVITGGHFDKDGILIPEKPHYESDGTLITSGTVYPRTIRRSDRNTWYVTKNGVKLDYFENEGFTYDPDRKPGCYYYLTTKNTETGGDVLLTEDQAREHPLCLDGYESMSNTTDFMYIDDAGNLQRDDKYSSDNGYWFHIDSDDGNMYAFKRLKWDAQTWENWPWSDKLEPWFMQKGSYERKDSAGNYLSDIGNMHLEYDYYDMGFDPYACRGLYDIDPAKGLYKNQCLVANSAMLKYDFLKDVIEQTPNKREGSVTTRKVVKEKIAKDCYVSMNILNGDGVNSKTTDKTKKNKTIYYNMYEEDDIKNYENSHPTLARIPIRIRIQTSCPLKSITVSDKDGPIAFYNYNDSNKEIGDPTKKISCTSDKEKTLELTMVEGTYKEDGTPIRKENDGTIVPDTTTLGEPIYTYEGLIYDVTGSYYLSKRNEEVTVKLTVEDQNGDPKSMEDKITIVRRDFFMLD